VDPNQRGPVRSIVTMVDEETSCRLEKKFFVIGEVTGREGLEERGEDIESCGNVSLGSRSWFFIRSTGKINKKHQTCSPVLD
jgi:hypothetical protein